MTHYQAQFQLLRFSISNDKLYDINYIQKVIEDSYFYALLNLIKSEDKIYNSSDIQDILTPIHTRMGTDNRHTALIIDIRLRIGYDSYSMSHTYDLFFDGYFGSHVKFTIMAEGIRS